MSEARQGGPCKRLHTVRAHKTPGEGRRADHAHLLAKHHAYAELKSVPGARNGDPGAPGDKRADQLVVDEVPTNLGGLCIQVEHRPTNRLISSKSTASSVASASESSSLDVRATRSTPPSRQGGDRLLDPCDRVTVDLLELRLRIGRRQPAEERGETPST